MVRPSRIIPALLLVATLLFASGSSLAATSLIVEVSNQNTTTSQFMRAFDAPSVGVGDFDKDGHLEVVAHNDNQFVYVISTKDERILAEFKPDYPPNWNVRPINDPVVADIDNDGALDIIIVTSAGHVCDYEYTGGTTSMTFAKRWCMRMDAYDGSETAADGGAAGGDVDGDGKMELFAQTETKGLYAFNHDGSVRWSKDKFGGNSGPLLTDLDNDGKMEVIYMSDGGTISTFDASSGNQKWGFWAGQYVKPGSVPVSGAAGDLDGDGKKEVVFIARAATFCCTVPEYRQNHFMIFVLNSNGALRWRDQPSWGNPMSYTHPIIADVNGDGKNDIITMDWNTIGHLPGNWEKLGQANVFAYDRNGVNLWHVQIDNSWSNDDLAMADVDNDGVQEILAIGYGPNGDGVWYLDSRTGVKEQHIGVGPWAALRGPFAADFNKDGKIDWGIPVNTADKGGAFRFYRTDAPCRIAFGGWNIPDPCRTGKTDTGGGGGGGTPPPPTTFDATFTPKGGNDWWVQVAVSGNKPIATVEARSNGGPWHNLEHKSWGDWAASFNVPAGSTVEFRAKSTSGDIKVSGGFKWPEGTPTGGGGTPPPPTGAFTASFTPKGGNDWWVQVAVGASKPLAKVEARANNGAWHNLEKKSWGDWAASFHVPAGSVIEFRATSTSGDTKVSGGFSWPSGTPVGGGGGGGGTTFTAKFLNARGNVWWVEVDVQSVSAVSKVEARINAGPWQTLEKTGWGSWAKSISAPSGSTVQFRATSSTGATATSGNFGWPP